jgi:transposase
MVEHADEVLSLPLTGHCTCGQAWESVHVQGQVAWQVMDVLTRTDPQQGPGRLPELRLQVTEYRADVEACPGCRHRQHAPFVEHVPGQVQHGPRVLDWRST